MFWRSSYGFFWDIGTLAEGASGVEELTFVLAFRAPEVKSYTFLYTVLWWGYCRGLIIAIIVVRGSESRYSNRYLEYTSK